MYEQKTLRTGVITSSPTCCGIWTLTVLVMLTALLILPPEPMPKYSGPSWHLVLNEDILLLLRLPPARTWAAGGGLAQHCNMQLGSRAVQGKKKFHFTNLYILCCSHETQTTCWDHPKMTELYQSLGKTLLPVVFFPNQMHCYNKNFQEWWNKIILTWEAVLLSRLNILQEKGLITYFKHGVEKLIYQLAWLECTLDLLSNLVALLQT